MKKLLAVLFLLAQSALAADPTKVIYHVSEPERLPFALANIANHIRGVGGPDKVTIVLVTNGPAVKALQKSSADPKLAETLAQLHTQKVELDACGNTLKQLNLGVGDLVDGFVRVDQGGVVRIAELQGQGYVYIKP